MQLQFLKRYQQWAPAVIFLVALTLRLIHVLQMSTSPFFNAPVVDAATYTEQATVYATGNWLGRSQGPYWQPPFYPYFLAVIKLLFPKSFFIAARVVQALLGSVTCMLIYCIGIRLFRPLLGFTAGIIAACYGPLIYFDARLVPASLAALLVLLSLLLLWRALENPQKSIFFAAGLTLGITVITVATCLLLIPLIVFWLIYVLAQNKERDWRYRWICVGIFLLGVSGVIAPVTLRNFIIGEDQVLISYNGGVNFYLGNNSDVEGTLNLRPGWEWEKLMGVPLRQGISIPSEKSSFFYRLAFAYIYEHPLEYAVLLTKKIAHFWQGDERERNQEIYYWRKYSTILKFTLWKWGIAFPFGLLSPLALLGLGVFSYRKRGGLPVAVILIYVVTTSVFFVTARYRIPIIPLLILFASYGAFTLVGIFQHRSIKQVWLASLGIAFGVLLINWNLKPMDMQGRASTYNDLGNVYLRQGRHDMALLKYEQAVRRDSTYWQAWFNLATMYAIRGDLPGAIPVLQRVLKYHPERGEVWSNLAGVYVGLEEYKQAVEVLNKAIQIEPPQRNNYVELIKLYIYLQQYDQADRVYHQALVDLADDAGLQALHESIGH